MTQFKDKIPAAGAKVEFLLHPATGAISTRISGLGFRSMYIVALSLDGKHLLASVPPGGMGQTMVYPQPSVLAYVQSDEQGMFGRNCPYCKRYFRTTHIMGHTYCPYCSEAASDLDFVSKEQWTYLTAFYDAFARAYIGKTDTSLDTADITDQTPAWHYSEEKQQFHFTCVTKDCHTQTDILGKYGYCPRCGLTNARKQFSESMEMDLVRLEEIKNTVSDKQQTEAEWEKMTIDALSKFEALGKHLKQRLLCHPLTAKRRKLLEKLNFQDPLTSDKSLESWFGIGLLEWAGTPANPKRQTSPSETLHVQKMVQVRHILMHNGGLVDQDYLDKSGDNQVRMGERISINDGETPRFIRCVREMGRNLLDNVEEGFSVGEQK